MSSVTAQPVAVAVESATTAASLSAQQLESTPADGDVNGGGGDIGEDVAVEDGQAHNAGSVPIKPWMKTKRDAAGVKKSGSRPHTALTTRERKMLRPRNASMVLHQLKPDVTCTFTQPGANLPFVAEIQMDGKVFTASNISKRQARSSAAEMALRSMVRGWSGGGAQSAADGGAERTPWRALAAFAMHKLLSDWQRGVVGVVPDVVDVNAACVIERACQASAVPTDGGGGNGCWDMQQDNEESWAVVRAPSNTPFLINVDGTKTSNSSAQPGPTSMDASASSDGDPITGACGTPKKKRRKRSVVDACGDGAAIVTQSADVCTHPVSLLYRYCPLARFIVSSVKVLAEPTLAHSVTVSLTVPPDHTFSASAGNKKLARMTAAREALAQLYNVQLPQ